MTSEAREAANTDRELWREIEGDYYAPSIHVTAQGGIGINVGGCVVVKSLRDWHALASRPTLSPQDETRNGFAPCPLCRQYSHSIGDDKLAEAFMHFQSMYAHPVRGHPMGHNFDEKTRDAAQVLMAAARAPKLDEGVIAEVLRPFARAADPYRGNQDGFELPLPRGPFFTKDDYAPTVTVGDLREARRLLTLIEGGGK